MGIPARSYVLHKHEICCKLFGKYIAVFRSKDLQQETEFKNHVGNYSSHIAS